jgi:hypothetical protein
MGFQRQPGSEQSLGRAVRRGGNAIGMVGVAGEMSKSACGKLLQGSGEEADTRVRPRAGAHPRVDSSGLAMKNRSKSMLIIPQP